MEEVTNVNDQVSAKVVPNTITINVSSAKKYLTQRDNTIRPFGTCNTTAMVMALSYSGVELPILQGYTQYEDALTDFLLHDPETLNFYSRIDPLNYARWKEFPNSLKVIPPNEYHAVLAYGTNRWVGKKAVEFSTSVPVDKIFGALAAGKPVILSGLWAGLRHIVCAVGFETRQLDILTSGKVDISQIENINIDDPFGNYKTKYQDQNGNDILVPYNEFLTICREYNSVNKWAHMMVSP